MHEGKHLFWSSRGTDVVLEYQAGSSQCPALGVSFRSECFEYWYSPWQRMAIHGFWLERELVARGMQGDDPLWLAGTKKEPGLSHDIVSDDPRG